MTTISHANIWSHNKDKSDCLESVAKGVPCSAKISAGISRRYDNHCDYIRLKPGGRLRFLPLPSLQHRELALFSNPMPQNLVFLSTVVLPSPPQGSHVMSFAASELLLF